MTASRTTINRIFPFSLRKALCRDSKSFSEVFSLYAKLISLSVLFFLLAVPAFTNAYQESPYDRPLLEVTKRAQSSGSTFALPAERVGFSITIKNLGELDAMHVVLTETLSQGLRLAEDSITINGQPAGNSTSFNESTRTITFDLGTIEGFSVVDEQYVYSSLVISFQADVTANLGASVSSLSRVNYQGYPSGASEELVLDHSLEVRQRSIRGTIWADLNGNGMLDAGEPRLAGISVSLLGSSGQPVLDIAGNPVAPVTTDANGVFTFVGLRTGGRVVAQMPPEHRVVPVLAEGGNQALPSGTNAVLYSPAVVGGWAQMPAPSPANHIGLVPIPPAESSLTKILHTPASEPAPSLSFTFQITPHSFNGSTLPAEVERLPMIGDQAPPPIAPNIGHRSFMINESNAQVSVSGGTRTLSLDIDLLGGIDLRGPDIIPGTYIWHVREVENSSGVNAQNNRSSVTYSQAENELRVVVSGSYPNQIIEVTTAIIKADTAIGDYGSPMYAWGTNSTGQLGLGDTSTRMIPHKTEYVRESVNAELEPREDWVIAATAAGGSLAVNREGQLYVWGAGRRTAQMGRGGNGPTGNITRPERLIIPAASSDNWVAVDVAGSDARTRMFAINEDGEVWHWGSRQNGLAGTTNHGSQSTPTRVAAELPNKWIGVSTVSMRDQNRHLTFLIDENNHVYSAGRRTAGALGRAGTSSGNESAFTRINASSTGKTTWHTVRAGANSVSFGICDCCRSLYSWGANNSSASAGARAGGDTDVPTPVDLSGVEGGENLRWSDVICQVNNRSWVALTECGRMFSWTASNTTGLGREGGAGTTGPNSSQRPREVGADRINLDEGIAWIGIGGGNSHSFAMTSDARMYGWGNGANGRLGLGNPDSQARPTFIMQTAGLQGFSQTGSGDHSMALIRTDPMTFTNVYDVVPIPDPVTTSAPIRKALRLENGATSSALSFDFEVRGRSFNGDSNLVDRLPQLDMPMVEGVGRISIAMSGPGLSSSLEGGITTLSRSVDILEGIEFTEAGFYLWEITERAGSSGTTPPSHVDYSQAVYELLVEITHTAGPHSPLQAQARITQVKADDGEATNTANQGISLQARGASGSGQLGFGDSESQVSPSFLLQSFGFSIAAQGAQQSPLSPHAGLSTMTFNNVYRVSAPTEASANLTKALRQIESHTSSNLSFDFIIERHSLNGDVSRANEIPQLGTSVVDGAGRLSLAMNAPGTTVGIEGGVATLSRSVDILQNQEFTLPGTYVWRLSEVPDSSGATAPSVVVYSRALFELRVEVSHSAGPGSSLQAQISVVQLLNDAGDPVSPSSTDMSDGAVISASSGASEIIFTNTHTRLSRLSLSKTVEGALANLAQDFTFDVRITPTALCGDTLVYRAQVYRGTTFLREETFHPATSRTVLLRHGERLDFGTLTVGTGFYVNEHAHKEHRSLVELYVANTFVPVDSNTTPNTALSIGERVVGEGRNSANFINVHSFIPPTGLNIDSNYMWFFLVSALVVLGASLATSSALKAPVTTTATSTPSNTTSTKNNTALHSARHIQHTSGVKGATSRLKNSVLKRAEYLLFKE